MKTSSVIRLAFKNLCHNFSRSTLTLISISLLSIVIITLSNLSYYFKVSCDDYLTKYIKEGGIGVQLSIEQDRNGALLDRLNNADIKDFIDRTKDMGILKEYSFQAVNHFPYGENSGIEESIGLYPYIGGETMYKGNPTLISGDYWQTTDSGKNHIWLAQRHQEALNLNMGASISIVIDGTSNDFLVVGIVDDYNSYIDYTYFDIDRILVYDNVNKYEDLSIIKPLLKLQKTATDKTIIMGDTLGMYGELKYMFLIVLGFCAFLTVLCIALSMGCILNTLKISIEGNSQSIGIMKALGMRNKNIYQYILFQVGILIVIGTAISTLFSWLLAKFTLEYQLTNIINFYGITFFDLSTGFNFLLPLINALILSLSVFLGSFKMLRKYFKKDAIAIMQEVE